MQCNFLQPYVPQAKNQIFWQAIADKNYALVNYLINLNNNLFFNLDENGALPIVSAIENHDFQLFNSLMVNPAFYSFLDDKGNSLALIAFKNDDLEIFHHLIRINPNLLTKENRNGEAPIFEVLKKNHEEIFDFINENYPQLMFFKNRYGKSMIEESIESENPRFFAEILKKSPYASYFFGDDFEDPLRNDFIYGIDNNFFREALRHIEKDELKKILYYNKDGEYSLLDDIMLSNRTDLLLSILEKVPDIFEDYCNIAALSGAFDKKLDNPYTFLPIQVFFVVKFGLDIHNDDNINLLKKFFDSAVILSLTNIDDNFAVIFQSLHKKHKRINDEAKNFFKDNNKFYEIYNLIYDALEIPEIEKFIEGVDGKFLILPSDILEHLSFFVFKFDKNNRITEVSYCDGNEVYNKQKIDRNSKQIFATTTFKLSHPIENTRDFIDEFMGLNSSPTDFDAFYDRGILFPEGIEFQKSYSVPCKKQIRGNCTMKSLNILAQYISSQLNPDSVEYQFDSDGKLSSYDKGQYKLHKDNIAEYCQKSLTDIVENLEAKSGKNKLEEFILERAKQIIEQYENRKLDKLHKDFGGIDGISMTSSSRSCSPSSPDGAQVSGVEQIGFQCA